MKHIITVGSIFPTTRDGNIEIVEDKGFGVFTVKFLNTGFERDTLRQQIVRGAVKDKSLQPTTRKATKPKFEVMLESGLVLKVVKLVDVLEHIEDKSPGKLYSMKFGTTKHKEIASISSI